GGAPASQDPGRPGGVTSNAATRRLPSHAALGLETVFATQHQRAKVRPAAKRFCRPTRKSPWSLLPAIRFRHRLTSYCLQILTENTSQWPQVLGQRPAPPF